MTAKNFQSISSIAIWKIDARYLEATPGNNFIWAVRAGFTSMPKQEFRSQNGGKFSVHVMSWIRSSGCYRLCCSLSHLIAFQKLRSINRISRSPPDYNHMTSGFVSACWIRICGPRPRNPSPWGQPKLSIHVWEPFKTNVKLAIPCTGKNKKNRFIRKL